MFRKIIQGFIVSFLVAILPALWKISVLTGPKLYILFTVGIMASVFQPKYNPFKNISNDKDKGTTNLIIWSVYLTGLAAVIEYIYFRFPGSAKWDISTWIASFVIFAGLAIRTWAVCTLGKYFTMHISVQRDQKVVRSGPYKYIRHPSYLGAYLTYISTAIFLRSWISLIATIILLPIAFLRRIHYEEKLLTKKGDLIKPNFDVNKIDVPIGFYPSKLVFEEKKEKIAKKEEDVLNKIVKHIVEETDLNEQQVTEKINVIAKEKNITDEVAAILLGIEYNLKFDDFIDEIEEKIFESN